MRLGFFASFITFAILIFYTIKKQAKRGRNEESDFWSREARANSVRRKPLDGLRYIKIPLESFPTHLLNEDTSVLECIDIIESLTSRKIVNLTGWSNTDLKLEYGAANLTELTEYDQNYTLLVRTLQKWADALLEAGYGKEASVLMEFAVSTNTDVSQTYLRLADYWISQGDPFQIERLIRTAEGLQSSTSGAIVRHLKEKYEQSLKSVNGMKIF